MPDASAKGKCQVTEDGLSGGENLENGDSVCPGGTPRKPRQPCQSDSLTTNWTEQKIFKVAVLENSLLS